MNFQTPVGNRRALLLNTLSGLLLLTVHGGRAAAAVAPSNVPLTPQHPSLQAGFSNGLGLRSPVGTNLAGIADWSTDYPFVDHMKMARPWFSGSASAWEDGRPLSLDANGNVLTLLPGQYARTVLFTGTPADPGLAGRVFHVRWSGTGVLEYGNVKVLQQQPGFDVIQLQGGTNPSAEKTAIITLVQTNATNPLRNVRLLPPGGLCASNPFAAVAGAAACPKGDFRAFATYSPQIVFNPLFLDGLKRYRVVRFMDWQRTNNSPQQAFSQRALPSHQFWSTDRGVPLETMIALANLLSVDPWFCIPHSASNAYVTSFAQVVKAQLSPARRAYIEYSNEVWNGMFDQTQFALDRAAELGLSQGDAYTGMARFYSLRSQQVFSLVAVALGGTERIRRVMSTQAVVPYYTEVIMAEGAASSVTDLFAIAPYFGATFTQAAEARELKRLGADGIFAWLANGRNASTVLPEYGSMPGVDATAEAQLRVLRPLGIPLTSYEGGQHLLAAGGLAADAELNALLDGVNRDARMRRTYMSYLTMWQRRTGQLMNHYVNCDRWSEWGRWGAKEYASQPRSQAPKLDAILNFIMLNPTKF